MLIGFTVMQHAFAGVSATKAWSPMSNAARSPSPAPAKSDLGLGRHPQGVFVSPETEQPARPQARHAGRPRRKPGSKSFTPPTSDRIRRALDSVLDQRRGRIIVARIENLRTPDIISCGSR
jgi:hypothetical protein